MAHLSPQHDVAIAEVIFYSFAFLTAIFLALQHGFGKSAGWYLVVLFTLIRLLGAAMYLATLQDPTNISLYIGAATLQSAGVTAIIMVQVAFLGKCVGLATHENVIGRDGQKTEEEGKASIAQVSTGRLRVVQLLLLAGLICGIVGGTKSSQHYTDTGTFNATDLSVVGLGVTLGGFGLLVLAAAIVALKLPGLRTPMGYSDELSGMHSYKPGRPESPNEIETATAQRYDGKTRRTEARWLIIEVLVSFPFLLVRLIYSCMFIFKHDNNFSTIFGDVGYFIGMSVVMEMIVILLAEVVGLTLTPRMAEEKALKAANKQRSRWYEHIPVIGLGFRLYRKHGNKY
ncbi:hypothetical protein MKZ38_008128 [Zalerion maritima]|uniref:DUF7702 domain-containing protein n=1 Tax=Zalerion maritima TaxID=339359 RepID=A0AAD5RHT7_9PEZI|nr:hypothetical protein MKZ38_008128 [Zalerion maritima]